MVLQEERRMVLQEERRMDDVRQGYLKIVLYLILKSASRFHRETRFENNQI